MFYLLLSVAMFTVATLAFYAGSLLFKLKAQNQRQAQTTNKRIEKILASIHMIALAIEQQQCNLSEGCIRLIHLLECIPSSNKPDVKQNYPKIYELFTAIKHLPTHEARKAQPLAVTAEQDQVREKIESDLKEPILLEVIHLKTLTL